MAYLLRMPVKSPRAERIPRNIRGINWNSSLTSGLELLWMPEIRVYDDGPTVMRDLVSGTVIPPRSGATNGSGDSDFGHYYESDRSSNDGYYNSSTGISLQGNWQSTISVWCEVGNQSSTYGRYLMRVNYNGSRSVAIRWHNQRFEGYIRYDGQGGWAASDTADYTQGALNYVAYAGGRHKMEVNGEESYLTRSGNGKTMGATSNAGLWIGTQGDGYEVEGKLYMGMSYGWQSVSARQALYAPETRWDIFKTGERPSYHFFKSAAAPSGYTATLATGGAPSSALAAVVHRKATSGLTGSVWSSTLLTLSNSTAATLTASTAFSGSLSGLVHRKATSASAAAPLSTSFSGLLNRSATITRTTVGSSSVGASVDREGLFTHQAEFSTYIVNRNFEPRIASFSGSIGLASGLNAVRHVKGAALQASVVTGSDFDASLRASGTLSGSLSFANSFSGLVNRSPTLSPSVGLTATTQGVVSRGAVLSHEMAEQLARLGDSPFTGITELVNNMKLYTDPALQYNNSYTSEAVKLNKEEKLPIMAFNIAAGNTVTVQGYIDETPDGNGVWMDIFSRTTSGWDAPRVPHTTRIVVTGPDATVNGTWVAVQSV